MQIFRSCLAFLFTICFTSCHQKKLSQIVRSLDKKIALSDKNETDKSITENFKNLQDEFIHENTQQFVVNKKKIITGKKGLKITVDPSSLEKIDGTSLDAPVSVCLIELTSSNDFFKGNAATVSDGKLLSSGGSYFIKMICNGKEVKIKKGKVLNVNFPVLTKDEMELFYGQRDEAGNMNWKQTETQLQTQNPVAGNSTVSFGFDEPIAPKFITDTASVPIYNSLKDYVFFYDKKLTIIQLVNELKSRCVDVRIDTLYKWPKNLPKQTLDTNYLIGLYGPQFQYRVLRGEVLRRQRKIDQQNEALQAKYQKDWQKYEDSKRENFVTVDLKDYYAPASITSLGWINCDRFLNRENIDIPVDLPITMQNKEINYFIIFKNFNGLVGGKISGQLTKTFLNNLPVGESVRSIAFTKSNGIYYYCVSDFIIKKGIPVAFNFKPVSQNEFQNLFKNGKQI